jgi:copper(I)-binding protein
VPTRRPLVIVVTALALIVSGLALESCGGSDDEAASTATTTETTTSTAETTTETTTTETTPPPATPTVIRVTVVDGAPKGGIVREEVKKGDKVVLVVTSDVADEIHLHGYDVSRDVAAGGTVRLPFKATIPGRFEVELEDRGVQIADITVNA